MKQTEKARINRAAIICHMVVVAVLMAAYILEWQKGSRTFGYLMIIVAFTVIPILAELILYRVNKESKLIQYVIGVLYMLMYIFILVTSTSSGAYVYIIPMYMMLILFSNIPLCSIVSVFCILANAAMIVQQAGPTGYTASELADVEIQLACLILASVFMIVACSVLKKVNKEKLRVLNQQKDKTDQLLSQVLATSDSMITGIAEVSDKMDHLGKSVSHIRVSMKEVSDGNTDSAKAVQNQLERTEDIHTHISRVKSTAENINGCMGSAVEEVTGGRAYLEKLVEQVERSMEANRLVETKMKQLGEQTDKMNTIIEIITSVASRTGMLALNASIEAARAGEAGKGFAVVAGEISTLANQTKTATVDIIDLIQHINRDIVEVREAEKVVTESNQSNAEHTRSVKESFERISDDTHNIEIQTTEMMGVVSDLENANTDIISSIQTISAITEEVSAHSTETYGACEENSRLVDQVYRIITGLSSDADKLKKHQQ